MPKIKEREISLDTIRSRITNEDAQEAKRWLDDIIQRCKHRGVVAEIVNLTPSRAKELQSRNMLNRPLRGSKITAYASDMKAGRWSLNGEAIIVDDKGAMINGQHRCEALVQSGASIDTMMVFGVTEDAKHTIDTGIVRGAGDILHISGHDYGTQIAALVRLVIAYERSGGESFAEANYISKAEIHLRAIADTAFRDAVVASQAYVKPAQNIAAPTILAFLCWATRRIDIAASEAYMDQIGKGMNLTEESPAFHVRNRLTTMKRTSRSAKIEVALRGWNAFRRNRPIKTYIKNTGTLPKLI
jgi:hypothetical protein